MSLGFRDEQKSQTRGKWNLLAGGFEIGGRLRSRGHIRQNLEGWKLKNILARGNNMNRDEESKYTVQSESFSI